MTEKFLLKKLIKGRIPESIVNRSKQAYRAPIASTFLGSTAPDYVKDVLSEKRIKEVGVFNTDSVIPLININFSKIGA